MGMDVDFTKSPLNLIYRRALVRFCLFVSFIIFITYQFTDKFKLIAVNNLSPQDSTDTYQWFLIINAITITAAIVMSASYNSIKKAESSIFDTTLNCLLAALSYTIIEFIQLYGMINSNAHYIASVCIQAFYLYTISNLIAELLKLPKKWAIGTGLIHTSILLLLHFIDLQDLRLGGRFEQNLILAFETHFLIFIAPFTTLIASSFSSEQRLAENSIFNSVKRRISKHNLSNNERFIFYAVIIIELVNSIILLGQYYNFYGNSGAKNSDSFHQAYFHGFMSWIPIFFISYKLFKQNIRSRVEAAKLSALVKPQIKRLFERQDFNNTDLATSVGMRAASFLINFDASNELTKQLPAFSRRFRGHEVLNVVRSIFEQKLLGEQLSDNSIVGAIDPEQSSTPCVDLLKGLAVLHLDGISLVEKRIKNLIKLFPILDQDLAKIISSETINEAINQAKWHYNLRFDWIEQAITDTAFKREYLLQIENSDKKNTDSTLISLDRSQKLHSVIILDKTAIDRLRFEAPHIINIIEKFKPKIGTEATRTEENIYFVRLEKLIPRLYKFYNIEKIRQRLSAFPIDTKTEKDFEFIDSQIKKAQTHKDMQNILNFFESKTWSGYQEKDQALDLLIEAFHCVTKMDTSGHNKNLNTKRILAIIETIGFPCQALYKAHQKKLLIRQPDHLASICLDSKHPRFHEAWILISSLSMERYSNEQILSLLAVIDKITSNTSTNQDEIIKFKIAEAFFNIASYLKPNSHAQLSATFNQLVKFACKESFPIEILNFLLDGYLHLKADKDIKLEFSEAGIMHLEKFLESLEKDAIDDSFETNSFLSRWKMVKRDIAESLPPVDILVS